MPTYVDESGDTGPEPSASDEFHLAAVWFETIEQALACDAAIAAVRTANGLKQTFVFHYCETPPHRREPFFQAVAKQPFHFACCTVDKRTAQQQGHDLTAELIVGAAVERITAAFTDFYLVAEETKGSPLNERVKVHHHNSKEYIRWISEGFKRPLSCKAPRASLVKKVTTERAESENLIQLVDMICGASRRHYNGEQSEYHYIASRRIGDVKWP